MSSLGFRGKAVVIAAGAILLTFAPARAQAQDTNEASVSITAADKAAAEQASIVFHRGQPTNTQRGKSSRSEVALTHRRSSTAPKSADSSGRGAVRYPADLSYQGGRVVDFAQSHAIYLLPNGKCPIPRCWGNPEGFLKALSNSDFIHLIDQYVGLAASRRYTVGTKAKVSYTPPKLPFTDDDMLAVVHAVAAATGKSGYGHIFHVFLPPGQDECFDSTFTVCYSPDNQNTFSYCAYHSSVDFTDIGHVLYSVEPYQNVDGCSVSPGSPNGQLVDSTNDVLSHELFETITDPDGDAWLNSTGLGLLFEEIGDECQFVIFTPTNGYFDPFVYEIDEKLYATQPEYSNALHGCSVH
jgi:hypothetical protein